MNLFNYRWLIESGRFEEAYDIMKRMARYNKKKSYDTLKYKEYALKRFKSDFADTMSNKMPLDYEQEVEEEIENELNLDSDIIFQKKICFPFSKCLKFCKIIILFNFLSFNFFGISLNIVNIIPVSSYTMLFFSTISGITGTLISNLNDKLGYKRALLIYLFSMFLSLLLTAILPFTSELNKQSWLLILKGSVALFSKTMIISAYNTAIIICSELFDAKLRLDVMLILNCLGCVLTLFAPQINILDYLVWKPLPSLVYALSALLSFYISYNLPIAKHLRRKKFETAF